MFLLLRGSPEGPDPVNSCSFIFSHGPVRMLDKNALSQLQSLKQEIQLSTPHFEGRVRSTGGRFGFVNTDDGQQFFLAPDEMDKVLPGDRIEFRVEPAGEGKEQAIIEKLLSTELNEFRQVHCAGQRSLR